MRPRLLACLSLVLLWLIPSAAHADEAFEARIEAWFAAYDALPVNPVTLGVKAGKKTAKTTIGVKGGTLKLDTPEALYELEIPEGAFLYPVEVTMAPLERVDGLGEKVTGVLGVKLGPDGMELWESAWLSVRPKASGTLAEFFPFAFFGSGEAPHYGSFVRAEDGSIFLQVTHFSGYGAALGTVTSEVLNQAKPDPDKFGREYGNPLQRLWGAVVDGSAGDTNVSTEGESVADVINRRIGDSKSPGGAARKRIDTEWASGNSCAGVDKALAFVTSVNAGIDKARKVNPEGAGAKRDKILLEPAQWRLILDCAKPPIDICFQTGNPKPLAALRKRLAAYRTESPDEQARMGSVLEWIDENLKLCAAYEMQIDANVSIDLEVAQFMSAINFAMPFKLDIASDRIVSTGKAEALSSSFTCAPDTGTKCEVLNFVVQEQPVLKMSLDDLPFFDPKGTLDPKAFKPNIQIGFATLNTRITAQGMSMKVPFETFFSMWYCHYRSEYSEKTKDFQFKGWDSGTYPTIFELRRPKNRIICEDFPSDLSMIAEFKHTPAGSPLPEPVMAGVPAGTE